MATRIGLIFLIGFFACSTSSLAAPVEDRSDATACGATSSPTGCADDDGTLPPPLVVSATALPDEARGRLLPTLYVSFAALEVADAYTTTVGLGHGAAEHNPVMAPAAGNTAALWAIKGVATFASIYLIDKMSRDHHRVQAFVVMVVMNGIAASVAANNVSVLRRLR